MCWLTAAFPVIDPLDAGLRFRQPVEHRGLDQQAEPVPAVLAGHRRDQLMPPLRVVRVDLDHGDRRHLAARVVQRRDRVDVHALPLADVIDLLADPVRRPRPRAPRPGHAARPPSRSPPRRTLVRYSSGVRPVPGHQRVPGRCLRGLRPQRRDAAGRELVEPEHPPRARPVRRSRPRARRTRRRRFPGTRSLASTDRPWAAARSAACRSSTVPIPRRRASRVHGEEQVGAVAGSRGRAGS